MTEPCEYCNGYGWYEIEDCDGTECNVDGSPCMTNCEVCNADGRR